MILTPVKTPQLAQRSTPIKVVPQSTPDSRHLACILCGLAPSGQIRRVFASAGASTGIFVHAVRSVWGLDLEKGSVKDRLPNARYCLKCFGVVEKSLCFKENLEKCVSELEKDSDTPAKQRMKRGNIGTPTPQKKQSKKSRGKLFIDHCYNRDSSILDESVLDLSLAHKSVMGFSDSDNEEDKNDHLGDTLLKMDGVLNSLCSKTVPPGPSVLRQFNTTKDMSHQDVISEIIVEMKRCVPQLLRILTAVCSPPHVLKPDCRTTIAMIYSMIMHCRNNQLSAMQVLNTCSAVRYHANNNLLEIFHKAHITLSANSKLGLLDRLGKSTNDLIIRSIRHGRGGKITTDNIDGRTIVDQMRISRKNKDYHYTASTYYPDRVNLSHLSDVGQVGDPADMSTYFLTPDEENILHNTCKILVGRILVKMCPALKWMKQSLPDHIDHPYSEEMCRKSEVYPLKVILKDPKYLGECVEILDQLTSLLKSCYEAAGQGEQFETARIPLGGDQLVRVRMAGAKGLKAGSISSTDRLEQLTPVVEEFFHVQQDFLEKLVKNHYHDNTTREPGTLSYYRCFIGRNNVNGVVKGKFKQHEDFVITVFEALLLHHAMKVLKMETLDDHPKACDIPQNIKLCHQKRKDENTERILSSVIHQLFLSFKKPVPPHPVHFQVIDPVVGDIAFQVLSNSLRPGNTVTVNTLGRTVTLKTPDTLDDEDHLRNYTLRFLRWMLPYLAFDDAIKEGDPVRSNICLKAMLPYFYGHSARSKYAVECIDFILKTEALLSPQLAWRTRLASFVNTHGLPGQNKPADMQQENNVRSTKDVFKGLGAGKTDKSLERCSSAAPVISTIVNHYQEMLNIHIRSGSHTHTSNSEDVKSLLERLETLDPLTNKPRRRLRNYKVRDTPFDFDHYKFFKYVQCTVDRLKMQA